MDLSKIISGNYTGLENRVSRVDIGFEVFEGLTVESHFMMLPFINGEESLKEFVEVIYDQIVAFCIPSDKRSKMQKKFLDSGGKAERYIIQLRDEAVDLFQKSKKQRKKSGEIGELILFILQEYLLNAPQVASKMFLKTNTEMPVHGSDGIHLLEKNGSLCVLWGESKLYKDPVQGIKEIVKSVVAFNTPGDDGKAPKERDIEIIKNFPNINDESLEEIILKYFDHYEPEYNNRMEAYSCFLGFDLTFYKKIEQADQKERESIFKDIYKKKIKDVCKAFSDEIKAANISNIEFYFFLIPFKSVSELRKLFFTRIGFPDFEDFETPEESETKEEN